MENVKKVLKFTGIILGVGILIVAPGGFLAGVYLLAKYKNKDKDVHTKRASTSGKVYKNCDGRMESVR